MTLGLIFWILMLLWLVLGGVQAWQSKTWFEVTAPLMPFLLFLLLGWKVFGAPVQG